MRQTQEELSDRHLRLFCNDCGGAVGIVFEVHCCDVDSHGIVVHPQGKQVAPADFPATASQRLSVVFPERSNLVDRGALLDQNDPRFSGLCAEGAQVQPATRQ